MEDLSDASFLGKFLMLPANVRLGANTLAYLASSSATKKKRDFIALTPGWASERDKLPVPARDPSGFRPQSPRTDCSSWNPEIRETAHPSKLKNCWCPDCKAHILACLLDFNFKQGKLCRLNFSKHRLLKQAYFA